MSVNTGTLSDEKAAFNNTRISLGGPDKVNSKSINYPRWRRKKLPEVRLSEHERGRRGCGTRGGPGTKEEQNGNFS